MNEVVVIGRDELRSILRQEIESIVPTTGPDNSVLGHVVDRNYLRRNLKWPRRRIEELERTNRLRPVFTGDGKTRYYKLGDCLRIDGELKQPACT